MQFIALQEFLSSKLTHLAHNPCLSAAHIP